MFIMKEDKKNYICAVPFTSLEIHDRARFLCCASWLTKYLPENSDPKQAWESKEANQIRESVLDGSYKYCDTVQCPYLHQLEHLGKTSIGKGNPLIPKNNIPPYIQKKLDQYRNGGLKPSIIQFSFDRTCNLKCPSCRIEIFTANKKKILEVENTIELIQEQYGQYAETLYITGSGDPFISVGFRNFLRNFNQTKWPKLTHIH